MLTAEQISAAREELDKVFSMAISGIEVDVFSGAIDAVWHEMLIEHDTYVNHCISTYGHVIGHSKGAGHGNVSFIESYEQRYGKLPPIWFVNNDGSFIKEDWDEYLHTGVVRASWNCQPDHSCVAPQREVKPPADKPSPQPPPQPIPSEPTAPPADPSGEPESMRA